MSIIDTLNDAAQALRDELAAQDLSNVQLVYGTDIGLADNVVLSTVAAITALSPSLLLLIDVAVPNRTPTPSLTVAPALPPIVVTSANGSQLAIGAMAGKCLVGISSVGGGFVGRLLVSPVVSGVKSSQTLYVRADGNDNNDGSANTPTAAKRTILNAATSGSNNFGFASTDLTIQLGQPIDPGDIADAYVLPNIPAIPGTFAVRGDITRPAYYPLIEDPSNAGPMSIFMAQSAILSGVEVKNPGTGVPSIVAAAGCTLAVDNTIMSNRGAGAAGAYFQMNPGSNLSVGDNLQLSGACDSAFYVNGGTMGAGENSAPNRIITLLNGFYARTMFSMAPKSEVDLLTFLEFDGSNTGAQWIVSIFAFLNTNGRTGGFIPGNPGLNYVDVDGRVR